MQTVEGNYTIPQFRYGDSALCGKTTNAMSDPDDGEILRCPQKGVAEELECLTSSEENGSFSPDTEKPMASQENEATPVGGKQQDNCAPRAPGFGINEHGNLDETKIGWNETTRTREDAPAGSSNYAAGGIPSSTRCLRRQNGAHWVGKWFPKFPFR